MKVLQRGNVHELQLDHGDPDHRFRLARAFLMEAADNGAWRVFVGMPEDWQLFARALQGIEGGTLLAATGDGLEPIVRHYAVADCELAEGRFEKHFCTCGKQLITLNQLTRGKCEYCYIDPEKEKEAQLIRERAGLCHPVRTHEREELAANVEANR